MNKLATITALLLLAAAVFIMSASADTIELKNGRKVVGKVVRENDKEITIEMKGLGEITLSRRQIAKITKDEKEGPKVPKHSEPEKPEPQDDGKDAPAEPKKAKGPVSTLLRAAVKTKKAFVDSQGSQVMVELAVKEGSILDIVGKRCAIDVFRDNTGKTLGSKKEDEDYSTAGLRSLNSIDGNLRRYDLIFRADEKPAFGASSLAVKGRLPFWYATKLKKGTIDKITLRAGEKFLFGEIEMTIINAKEIKSLSGKEKHLHVELSFTPDGPFIIDCIDGLTFTGPDGKAIPWHEGKGSSEQVGEGPAAFTMTWVLRWKVPEVKLEYELWTDPQYRHVDIDATARIGKWEK